MPNQEYGNDEFRDVIEAGQDMPLAIHDQKETTRSSQLQYKTPKADYEDTEFRGSIAKPVTQFTGTNSEEAQQH